MYCSSNPSEPPSSAAQSRFYFSKNHMTKRGFALQVIYGSPLFFTAWPLKALSRINHFSSFFLFQVLFSSFLIFRINALNSAAFRQDSGNCGCHNQRWHKNHFLCSLDKSIINIHVVPHLYECGITPRCLMWVLFLIHTLPLQIYDF